MTFSFRLFYSLFISITCFGVTSCTEKKTDDAIKSYTFWAGTPPQNDVKVVHGKYWESANFTKEYIVYLELAASANWKKKFITQNDLVEASNVSNLPTDIPKWFKFSSNIKLWKHANSDQSLYIEDQPTGHLFLYEEQL